MMSILFISGAEIIVVFLIFLLLFGAKSIPGLARNMGRAMRQFKDASQDIQREMGGAATDVKRHVQEQRKAMDQMMEEPKAKTPKVTAPNVTTPKVTAPNVTTPKDTPKDS